MKPHWLDDFSPLRVMHKHIQAADYNLIRLCLLREYLPWHVSLKRFPCLTCILEDSIWICVDECSNNQPIMAWTNFHISERAALDTPMECDLHIYHVHAGLIMSKALDALVEAVDEHHKLHSNDHYPVSPLNN